jgi:thiopeptide-type bacteriocin biosynthesis protein
MMKRVRFADAGFFVFRVPLLPVAAFQQSQRPFDSTRPSPAEARAESWLAPLKRSELANAIALQSPSLWNAIGRARHAVVGRDDSRAALALYRYTARAALRCTPRGLFAAAGFGRIAKSTQLQFGGATSARVRVEPSLDYLSALLDQELGTRRHRGVRLVANPTLIRFGDTLALWETSGTGANRVSRQVRLRASPVLQRLVDLLGTGTMNERRVRSLLTAAGVSKDQHDQRLDELLSAQILVPALGVCTLSTDPVGRFIEQLPRGGRLGKVRTALSDAQAQLGRRCENPIELSLPLLEALRRTLPPVPGFEHANQVFHVEAQCNASTITLNQAVVSELTTAIERMHFGFADLHSERLLPFVNLFTERFGEATVPLLRVLDPEQGVGTAVLEAIPSSRWAKRGRRAAMLRLVHNALEQRSTVVEADETFWKSIADEDLPDLPPAFSAIVRVVAESGGAVDSGAYEVLLDGVVGSAGTELWSRHGRLSEEVRSHCRELRRRVPVDAVHTVRADVAFTPLRGADILSRPALEPWRIACGAAAAEAGVTTLSLAELFVQVRNGRVRLVSRPVAGEVIPAIGSAVDPTVLGSPLFTFLALVASQQGSTPLRWEWGDLADSAFLPRVRRGRVVLAPARWRIDRAELAALRPTGPGEDPRAQWTGWRAGRRLPRWVSIRDGDESLGCDLDREIGRAMLEKHVARHGFALLDELRGEPADLCVSDGAERYTHELIIPFVRQADTSTVAARDEVTGITPRTWATKFRDGVKLPGSEWVYAKLYASPRAIQSMLREDIAALVTRLKAECLVCEWFFFRYDDPDWHLRLRVRAPGSAERARVLDLIESTTRSLQLREAVWRLQYDTYFREVERFGGPKVCGLVERLFAAESELALAALETWTDDDTYDAQTMRLAMGWVLFVWARLGLTPRNVAQLSRGLRRAIVRHDPAAREANRASRGRLEPISVFERGDPWQIYSRRAGGPLDRIRAAAAAGALGVGLHELAGDLAHLSINRFFSTRHADREYELYSALERHAHRVMSVACRSNPSARA